MANDIEVGIKPVLDDSALDGAEKKSKKSGKKIGKNVGEGVESGFKAGLSGFQKAVIGIGSAVVSGLAVRTVINAAREEQDAINQLNTSLKLAGEFSLEASQSFQDLASNIQETSTIGNETALEFGALARNFTDSNEAAEDLLKAAVDLSAATGLTLDSSVKNLGKTFAGLTGELGESVPALRNLTAEQLKAGAAIDLITERFGGAAQAQLNTFSGAVEQAGNVFGDLLERIGDLFIKSPVLIKIIKDISALFVQAAKAVGDFGKSGDVIGTILINLIKFAEGVNMFVVAPIELVVNGVKVVFNGVLTALQAFVATFANLLDQTIGRIVRAVAPNSAVATGITAFKDSANETFEEFGTDAASSLENLFNFDVSGKAGLFLERYRGSLEDVKAVTEEAATDIAMKSTAAAETAKENFITINDNLKSGIVKGTQAMIKGIQKGENAFSALGGALLGIIGDMATQIGTTLIGIGIGVDAIKLSLGTLSGGPAIAAGVALVAIGALLSSLQGGSATAGAGSTAGGDAATEATASAFDENIEEKQQLQASLVVQGDVLDRRETALAILETLQEVGDSNDVRITA